ncbi:MAG: hypothetical protein RL514_3182 [Verrucomicrobiota bacterium]|jgi:hypothetical protein
MSMNPVMPPDELPREPMRWQVKFALALVTVVGLFTLWAWLEHERAKAGLAAYKQQLVARGEKLDLKDHLPTLPKPEENAAPALLAAVESMPKRPPSGQRAAAMTLTASGRARVAWQQPELPTAEHPDVWPEVFAYVEDERPALLAAAQALERPRWGVAVDYSRLYEGLAVAHLTSLRVLAMAQTEAVLTDLHFDRPAEAYTNLLAQTRLVQRLDEPLLISQLVRYALATVAVSATWEALQKPGWTDAQLAELQLTWERMEVLKNFVAASELERCLVPNWFAMYRSDPGKLREMLAMMSSGSASSSPSLWEALWEQLFDNPTKAAGTAQEIWRLGTWLAWNSYADERYQFAATQPWVELDRVALRAPNSFAASTRIEALGKLTTPAPEALLVSHGFPNNTQGIRRRLANLESVRRVTVTALALERHRLRHGSYPESLAALVPSFLREVPIDFQDAQPLRYQREANGQFRLWSVGDNGTDEGGNNEFPAAPSATPAAPTVAPPRTWMNDRDLLWPLPATAAEVATLHSDFAAERAKKGKP